MSNNIKTVATTEVVEQKITEIIGAAPEALNTLDELAAALNDDKNYCVWLAQQKTTCVHPSAGPAIQVNTHQTRSLPHGPQPFSSAFLQGEPGMCPGQIRGSQAQEAVSLDSSGLDSES